MATPIRPELAEATKRVLRDHGGGYRPLTLQQASEQSGVSATMIQAMSKGRPVGCEGVIRFAHAFGEDVPAWLELAGYSDIACLWGRGSPPVVVCGDIESLLDAVPMSRRDKARLAAKRTIEQLIVPLYTEVTAR